MLCALFFAKRESHLPSWQRITLGKLVPFLCGSVADFEEMEMSHV